MPPTVATLGILLKRLPSGFFAIEKVLQESFGDSKIGAGDVLCAVGGQSVCHLSHAQMSTMLIGQFGSKTTVDIGHPRANGELPMIRHEVCFLYCGVEHLVGTPTRPDEGAGVVGTELASLQGESGRAESEGGAHFEGANHPDNIHGSPVPSSHELHPVVWALNQGIIRSKLRRERNGEAELTDYVSDLLWRHLHTCCHLSDDFF